MLLPLSKSFLISFTTLCKIIVTTNCDGYKLTCDQILRVFFSADRGDNGSNYTQIMIAIDSIIIENGHTTYRKRIGFCTCTMKDVPKIILATENFYRAVTMCM